MKLLYITNGINGSGGLERVLSIKASALADDFGHEVHILVINNAHQNPFYSFSEKITFHTIALTRNPLGYVYGIKKVVKKVSPDIVLVCDDGLKGFFVPMILRTKTPIVYERHASIAINTNPSLKGKITKWLMQSLSGTFDKFVVLTAANQTEWKSENIVVIPNPLTFYPQESATLLAKKAIVVGSQSFVKGYDLLLQVWEKVSEKQPDWELHCYGKADAANRYEKMRTEKQLANVFFHEPVKNIQEKYLESSLLVLPSRSEGFGMVLIEAMASGLPCVSFDCPSGPRDIIQDGVDGFLIAAEQTESMAQKIISLIENDTLRLQMGKSARQNVKRYLPEHILGQWNQLFKTLV